LTAAAIAGTAAHHAFELGAGVGLVFQPELGLPGALALWGVTLPVGFLTAARSDSALEPLLAWSRGSALGGVAVHYMLWPWERRRGLPWLTEAEGLSDGQLPAYNTLLYLWGAAAVGALLVETPKRSRTWALLGLAGTVVFRQTARYHFKWANEQARTNPKWWNRGLQP
jgi:hypothetical protein